jgi:hypothetical protein
MFRRRKPTSWTIIRRLSEAGEVAAPNDQQYFLVLYSHGLYEDQVETRERVEDHPRSRRQKNVS